MSNGQDRRQAIASAAILEHPQQGRIVETTPALGKGHDGLFDHVLVGLLPRVEIKVITDNEKGPGDMRGIAVPKIVFLTK